MNRKKQTLLGKESGERGENNASERKEWRGSSTKNNTLGIVPLCCSSFTFLPLHRSSQTPKQKKTGSLKKRTLMGVTEK
jgi:hypothetical protein